MKRIPFGLVGSTLLFDGPSLWACPQCRPVVNAGVYNQDFAATMVVLLLPLAVLFVIGIGTYYSDAIAAKFRRHR